MNYFTIYCNDKHEIATKILLQWSDINYFTIFQFNKFDVIIYCNEDIVAIIWSKLFVPIICNRKHSLSSFESNSFTISPFHTSKFTLRNSLAKWM